MLFFRLCLLFSLSHLPYHITLMYQPHLLLLRIIPSASPPPHLIHLLPISIAFELVLVPVQNINQESFAVFRWSIHANDHSASLTVSQESTLVIINGESWDESFLNRNLNP